MLALSRCAAVTQKRVKRGIDPRVLARRLGTHPVSAAKSKPTRAAAIGLASLLILLLAVLVERRHEAEAAERQLAEDRQSLAPEQQRAGEAQARLARFEALEKRARERRELTPGARAMASLPAHYRDNPELTRTYFRPMIRRHFAELFEPGLLTGAEQEQMEAMLLRLGPTLDMMGQIALGWDEPGQEALLTKALGAELIPEVTATFGEAIGERFRQTLRTRDVHLAMDNLAVKLLHAGAPLDQQASAQLTALLVEAGNAAPHEQRMRLQALDWDLVMQRAPALLSATQLRALQAIKARARFDQEYERVSGYTVEPRLPEPER